MIAYVANWTIANAIATTTRTTPETRHRTLGAVESFSSDSPLTNSC
jgi:hypothetical protein